jgi:aspartyl-tRNA(Asn)/glutamyl-tRNA(Gln) amidotransferase subunit C
MTLKMRDAAVTDGGKREEILANAPQQARGFFVVPKVVE